MEEIAQGCGEEDEFDVSAAQLMPEMRTLRQCTEELKRLDAEIEREAGKNASDCGAEESANDYTEIRTKVVITRTRMADMADKRGVWGWTAAARS